MTRAVCAACLLCLITSLPLAGHAAEGPDPNRETIALGGPRGAKITIDRLADKFAVTVEMAPVSCFDAPTNSSVNRTKAESYALTGFCGSGFGKAKQLTHETLKSIQADAVFQRVTVESAGLEGGKYRLRLLIPEDGIQARPPQPVESRPFDRTSPLFTRYGDHEATISALGRTLVADMATLVDNQAARQTRSSDLISAVETLRPAGKERFATLRHVIQSDILLLDTTEKPELEKKILAAMRQWDQEVDACVKALSAGK